MISHARWDLLWKIYYRDVDGNIWLIDQNKSKHYIDTVDVCEILHQLVDGLSHYNPMIYSFS